jgi:hypothetical protein
MTCVGVSEVPISNDMARFFVSFFVSFSVNNNKADHLAKEGAYRLDKQ